jgi:hypothetical protein
LLLLSLSCTHVHPPEVLQKLYLREVQLKPSRYPSYRKIGSHPLPSTSKARFLEVSVPAKIQQSGLVEFLSEGRFDKFPATFIHRRYPSCMFLDLIFLQAFHRVWIETRSGWNP